MSATDANQSDGNATAQATATLPADPKVGTPPSPQQQQATDAKTPLLSGSAEQKPGDAQKTEAPKVEVKKPNAPEKYEFKAPQGQSFNDPQVLKAYGDVARELDLSQEAAQKALDKVATVMHQRDSERLSAIRDGWVTQAQSDKEFGGDAFDANLATANAALTKYGTPGLVQVLKESGLGDHPEVIRVFLKIGRAISEDRHAGGGSPPQTQKDLAHRLHPGLK